MIRRLRNRQPPGLTGRIVLANTLMILVLLSAVIFFMIQEFHEAPQKEFHEFSENLASVSAAAIANAVYNAIGVRIRDLPITPEKVLRALGRL